jgi:DNA-binding MarR family transcriptional regulator
MSHSAFDLNDHHHTTEAKITVGFERIAVALRAMLWQECLSTGISPIQGQILIFCLNHPPQMCRIGHLAKEFSLTKPTISDAVKTLERKELLIKKNDPEDQRSIDLILTEKGIATAKQVVTFSDPLRKMVAQLPESQKQQLQLMLAQLTIELKEIGVLNAQRSCVACKHCVVKSNKKQYYCNFYQAKMTLAELRIDCADFSALPNQEKKTAAVEERIRANATK